MDSPAAPASVATPQLTEPFHSNSRPRHQHSLKDWAGATPSWSSSSRLKGNGRWIRSGHLPRIPSLYLSQQPPQADVWVFLRGLLLLVCLEARKQETHSFLQRARDAFFFARSDQLTTCKCHGSMQGLLFGRSSSRNHRLYQLPLWEMRYLLGHVLHCSRYDERDTNRLFNYNWSFRVLINKTLSTDSAYQQEVIKRRCLSTVRW